MSTECDIIQTLQVLNPEGTTTESTGSRPIEDGITPIPVGQQYVDVLFAEGPHASYNFDELLVENLVDDPPLGIMVVLVSFMDEDGFRIMFNASPDSAFYNLRWRVTI